MASHYCLDCAESLCDSCCSMHSRIRSSRRHRVVRRGTQLSAQDLRAGPAAHCDQHADEPLKMFCCDCARCICFLCYAEHHTGHRCQVASHQWRRNRGFRRSGATEIFLGKTLTKIIKIVATR